MGIFLTVMAVWLVSYVVVFGLLPRLKQWLNPTPPSPATVYPPPVPPVTYLPQSEVDRRFAEIVGAR